MRNSDAHLIYSCSSGRRINPTQSIYVGEHVWMGQDVRLLKGTQIDSGSIIGAASVVAGKKIMHNSSWSANPSRQIGEGVFGIMQMFIIGLQRERKKVFCIRNILKNINRIVMRIIGHISMMNRSA